MPLHIFEARYRSMVAYCLEHDRRFGLIHHDSDDQGPFLLEESRVGSMVRIDKYQPLPDGRSLILVRCDARFEIVHGMEQRTLYYEAEVRPYLDLSHPRSDAIQVARRQTLELFDAVVASMEEPPEELPDLDLSCDLSFQLAPLVQIDTRWQQSFLELRQETHRLERLDAVFQAAVDRA